MLSTPIRVLYTILLATTAASAQSPDRLPKVPEWPGLARVGDRTAMLTEQPPGGPAFGTSEHTAMAEAILSKSKNARTCSEALARAQWRQDIVLQTWSPAHFDNCACDESLDYIRSELAEVDKLVGTASRLSAATVSSAMAHLGRVLHALQDFYAHTNYVELMRDEHPKDFSRVPIVTPWNDDGAARLRALVRERGLHSGRVWWSTPKLCALSVLVHAEMAKERGVKASEEPIPGWQNRSLYRAAYTLADRTSGEFILYTFRRWPALQPACDGAIAFIGPVDNRGR